LPRQRKKKN